MLQNRFDLDMQQGATFQLQLIVQDANSNAVNLNGYSALMEIRSSYSNNTIAEKLSVANGEITLVGNNMYQLVLPATRTANVYVDLNNGIPPKSMYVYDLGITDPYGVVTKIMYGSINFYGQVSRWKP